MPYCPSLKMKTLQQGVRVRVRVSWVRVSGLGLVGLG